MAKEIKVPDIGDFDAVEVIEVLVSEGDTVEKEQALITLESDKATLEVPASAAGTVAEMKVSEGDSVSEGDVILLLEEQQEGERDQGTGDREEKKEEETADSEDKEEEKEDTGDAAQEKEAKEEDKGKEEKTRQQGAERAEAAAHDKPAGNGNSTLAPIDEDAFDKAHASPSVRKFARELGVDLGRIEGSARKGRIVISDVQAYVKRSMRSAQAAGPAVSGGVPAQPEIDFSQFGDVETVELPRIRKLSAQAVHRNWLLIPHVTQFDNADITEMEAFRKANKEAAGEQGVKLTPLAFLLKASAAALAEFPDLNSSLSADGAHLIHKQYCHIGVAVDTDNGLLMPVIRDVDQKGIYQLARELGEVSERARAGKLKGDEMKGACFSISSLGGVGGTAFTPIVNSPEVAMLGVSKHDWQPVWQDGAFVPRLILPLSLSYDHRVIDGAAAARITSFLAAVLGDIRKLLL